MNEADRSSRDVISLRDAAGPAQTQREVVCRPFHFQKRGQNFFGSHDVMICVRGTGHVIEKSSFEEPCPGVTGYTAWESHHHS